MYNHTTLFNISKKYTFQEIEYVYLRFTNNNEEVLDKNDTRKSLVDVCDIFQIKREQLLVVLCMMIDTYGYTKKYELVNTLIDNCENILVCELCDCVTRELLDMFGDKNIQNYTTLCYVLKKCICWSVLYIHRNNSVLMEITDIPYYNILIPHYIEPFKKPFIGETLNQKQHQAIQDIIKYYIMFCNPIQFQLHLSKRKTIVEFKMKCFLNAYDILINQFPRSKTLECMQRFIKNPTPPIEGDEMEHINWFTQAHRRHPLLIDCIAKL